MRYMLLIYSEEKIWSEDERQHCFAASADLAMQLHRDGKCIASAPLRPVAVATSVQVRDGKKHITDGPFAETREQLGGYYLIEARDLDEAIEIAAQIPAVTKGTIEIRPVLTIDGLPG
jgi:hypothetical protein